MNVRDRIFAANDTKREGPLEIPEWGIVKEDGVYACSLSVGEHNRIENEYAKRKDEHGSIKDVDGLREMAVVFGLRYADGKPVFIASDIKELASRNSQVVTRLSSLVLKLSGMSAEGQNEARDVLKNGQTSDDFFASAAA